MNGFNRAVALGSLSLLVVLAVALSGCSKQYLVKSRKATERTRSVKLLKSDHYHGHELTWVLIKETVKKSTVLANYEQSADGERLVDVKTALDASNVEETLWYCYRIPTKSRPQCYRANWSEKERGPIDLIGDDVRLRSGAAVPRGPHDSGDVPDADDKEADD